jgi:hypothetical protein
MDTCPGKPCNGGARRDRTADILLAKQALSQLSYGPESSVTARGRERHGSRHFPMASHAALRGSEGWWAWEDLNFRPHAYQARALTN